MYLVVIFGFFFSSTRRHTRCALVTGVQTCALPISRFDQVRLRLTDSHYPLALERTRVTTHQTRIEQRRSNMQDFLANYGLWLLIEIGRASCRERVCQ